MAIMVIPVTASGTVNFLAPAPTLIKVLAAFIVTVIPMSESLRAFGSKPNFAKIEAMEVEVAAQVATPRAVVRRGASTRERIEAILRDSPEMTYREIAAKARTGYNNAHRIVKEIRQARTTAIES